MRFNRILIARLAGVVLLLVANSVWSFGDQWYLGLGGGVSNLEPNPDEAGLNVEKNQGATGSLILGRNIEALYHDQDALSAQIALVTRFGGTRKPTRRPPQLPVPELAGPKLPVPDLPKVGVQEDSVPGVLVPDVQADSQPISDKPVTQIENDRDADGVVDSVDACQNSAIGYPVTENGCPLFNGVLSGIQFVDLTSDLAPTATVQLDYLANLLKRYPDARVELLAHTDSRGDIRSQSILTRARLRTVGTYLVGQGIRANRLVLRSFGGSRPIYDNATTEGLLGNNRIEVIEHRNPQ